MTNDFYYSNPDKIEMETNKHTVLQTFTVKKGETLNFECKFDIDQAAKKNNAVWLMLYAGN